MVEIRLVTTPAEVATTARLARDIWTEHYVPIIGHDQVEYMLERFQSAEAIARQIAEGHEYYLLLEGDEAVAYAAASAEPDEEAVFLSKFYVRKDRRGRGLGRALLEFIEARFRRRGCRTLWLTVNKRNPTVAWYERMGFTNAGPTVKDIGGGFVMDDYKMVKRLAADADPAN